MQLYNSRSQRKEEFQPLVNRVTLYVCGITPYDTTHLGHAFTYGAFDILVRFLEWKGVSVRYAQNVTDIDDDVLRKAKQVGKDWRTLGNEWTTHFIDDLRSLNVRPPDDYPRATETIPEIVAMSRALIECGAAYESNGSVYFSFEAFKSFGELSHIPKEEMLSVANERGNHPDDPNKRNPIDFVLWQRQAEGEPGWSSPWGEGRPGWHIECSAMVNKFLGPRIDIHGGGADLIFPHHECETAQSVTASGQEPFVRVWMHTSMVRNAGEKMSKSLGNLVMVSDLLRAYSPDAIRLYLLIHHYRESWEYDAHALEQSAAMADRWRRAAGAEMGEGQPGLDDIRQEFQRAMEDDLDTPRAVALLDRLVGDLLEGRVSDKNTGSGRQSLFELGGVLGLRLGKPGVETRVSQGWNRHRVKFSRPA